ncbi:MAG: small multi-drug export protein [Phycisphaerae bacterium]|nr:small multi-drug export protein [Phycisphaerae bacterium]
MTGPDSRPDPGPEPSLEATTRRLLDEEGRAGDQFRREHPLTWWLTLVGPFAATALLLLLILVTHDLAFLKKLVATAVATFFLFGRFVILGGGEKVAADDGMAEAAAFLTRGELFTMVMWMDLATACVLIYHLGFLFRIPFLGPRMLGLVEDGRFILEKQPWIRRATFVGLIAFVAVPLAATGSVGGAIFGRLLGLSRGGTFVAIFLGSLLGCGVMYLGAGVLNRYLDPDDPWLKIGGIAVIVGLVLLLNWRYSRMKKASRRAG